MAAVRSVVNDPVAATSYCISESLPDTGGVSWSLLALAGDSVVRLKATGPALDPYERETTTTASSLDVTVQRSTAIESIGVRVDAPSKERYGSDNWTWKRVWIVTFTDGSTYEMPAPDELSEPFCRKRADNLAEKILEKLAGQPA